MAFLKSIYLTEEIGLRLPIVATSSRVIWVCSEHTEALVATAKLLARGYVSTFCKVGADYEVTVELAQV